MKRFFEPGRAVHCTGAFFSRCRITPFLGTQAKNAKGRGHAEPVLPLPPRLALPLPTGAGRGEGNRRHLALSRGAVTLAGLLIGAFIGLILAPILPPIPKAEAATSTAGSTAGAFDVSDSGAATYSIPIAVPPGVRGLQPGLAIAYNSQNRDNGLLGIGWSLAGLSVIHRCGATIAIDGFKGGVNYDANDKFCLDGERLIAIGNNEYRTEHESWQRVYASDGSTNPSYFTVFSPDGGTRIYGGSTDSRIEAQGQAQGSGIARVWALNRVQDKRGNYLTVSYQEDNGYGDYRPSRIDYTGNAINGAVPKSFIQFYYQSRSDSGQYHWEGGAYQFDLYRLGTIYTYADGVLTKAYWLGYDNGGQVGKSRLTSVTECGYDAAVQYCLQPTTFAWQGPTGHVAATWTGAAYQGTNSDFADLNGDGRADYLTGSGSTRLVSLSTGTAYAAATTWNGSGVSCGIDGSSSGCYGGAASAWNGHGKNYGDINGDGLADALTIWGGNTSGARPTNSGFYPHYWYTTVGLSTGTGFQTATNWLLGATTAHDSANIYYYDNLHADLNGDGRLDMFAANHYDGVGGASFGLNIAGTSTGSGFTGFACCSTPQTHLDDFGSADLNGDGRDEILVLNGSGSLPVHLSSGPGATLQYWANPAASFQTSRFADVNGDGLQDVVVVGANPWKLALSTGKNTITPYQFTGPTTENTGAYTTPDQANRMKLHFADFNGDGMDDVAFVDPANNGSYKICYAAATTYVCGAVTSFPGWTATSAIEVADINGDGMADLAAVSTAASSNHALQLSTGTPDMLKSITNGQGAKVTVTYKPLTDGSVYSKYLSSVTYPEKLVQDATYVISSHAQSNGVGGTNTWTYKYYGLKYDQQAARSLGFYLTQTTGPDGILQTTYFYQSRQLAGQEYIRTTTVGGIQRKYESFTRSYVNPVSGNSLIVLPRLTSSYSTGTDLNGASLGTTSIGYSNFDTYGFPQTVTTTRADAYSSTANPYVSTTTNTYNHDTVNWLLGRISQTSVTSTAPSQAAITRTSSFTYVPTYGELQTETLEPSSTDSAIKLTTTYGYDVFGNKYTTSVTGWNGSATETRTATTAFDATGRFLVRTTNALGHNAYVDTYDTRFGVPTYARDANNIATSAQYDGFGRKISETQYAGTATPITTSITYATWSAPGGTGVSATTNTSGLGWTTVYSDILGRNTWTSSSGFFGANVWRYTSFDGLGRKSAESLPYYGGQTSYQTTFTYNDALSRLTKVSRPLDAQGLPCDVTTGYNGLSTTVTNCKNQYVTTTKNVVGWTLSTTDNGGTVTNTYDSLGNLIAVRDPLGNTSTMGYDLRGRKRTMQDPDMGFTWFYDYNAFGELIRQQDAKNQVTTLTYDALGRMKTRTRPEGTTTWTYDVGTQALGKLSSVTSPGYSESQTYDATRGLATINTRVINGASYATTTAYDSLARPSYLTYPTGFKIENRYDGFGHLAEVWSNSLTTNVRYWKANSADAQGAITNEILGNNLTSTYTYDPGTGRLRTMDTKDSASAMLRNLSFQWDIVGNLTSRSWWDGAATRTESFTYDGYLNRLTGVTGPVNKSYTYDALGNFTNKSDVGNYSYTGCGGRPHAVCATSSGSVTTSFTYDANGNQLTGNGRTQTWTSFNKVKQVTKGATTSTFAYGAGDQRISKVTGSSTIHYVGKLYDKETSGTFVGHQHYVYAGSNLVGVYRSRNQGSPTTFMTYYHGDHLGSIDTVTGEGGGVAARFSFDAWGRPRNPNGTDNASASSDYRGFTKHEHDDEVGLINMNAREYDPVIGRFISADPVLDRGVVPSQGLNRYMYVGNNPLSFVDPDGYGLKKWWKKNQRKIRGYFKAVLAVAIEVICDGCGYGAAFFAASGGINEINGTRKGDPGYQPVQGSIGVGGSTNNSFNQGNYFFQAGGVSPSQLNAGGGTVLYAGNFGTAPVSRSSGADPGAMYFVPEVLGRAAQYELSKGNPHEYRFSTYACTIGMPGCSIERVFAEVLRCPTPFGCYDRPVRDEQRSSLSIGDVEHRVFSDLHVLYNDTLPGHLLDPGFVRRGVLTVDNAIFIETYGYGTGRYPTTNRFVGEAAFRRLDGEIKERLGY